MRLLLAEDEAELATWLGCALRQSDHIVDWVADGRLVEPSLNEVEYDALILDLGLPGIDGERVLERLRAIDHRLPVLVLTARDSLLGRVRALRKGADDFMSKPFSLEELEARLTALVRRARGIERPRLACGPLVYDAAMRRFNLDGQPLQLPPRAARLLLALVQESGEVVPRKTLCERIFDDEREAMSEALDVLVCRLRKQLSGTPLQIVTLRGLGFLLECR